MKSLKSVIQVAIGAAIGVLIGGSLVWAHGGDPTRVHGCVLSPGQPNAPNVRIVGENEACPPGWTAVDWAIAGPPGPAGERGAVGPQGAAGVPGPPGPSPPRSEIRDEILDVGFPRSAIRVSEASLGPNRDPRKTVTAWCPRSHALVISGGYVVSPPGPIPGTFRPEAFSVLSSARRTAGLLQGWRVDTYRMMTTGHRDRRPRQPWRLTTRVECADTS